MITVIQIRGMDTQVQELEKGRLTVNMWHKLYCVEYILNKMHDSMTGLGYNLEESVVMK